MTRIFAAWLCLIGFAVAGIGVAGVAASASAKQVSIDYEGLDVLGNLELAPGKSLKNDGAALLVHGTLAHHRMELIASLQELLRERGINSLAITLSLGLDARRGMFNCAIEHDHRHEDALGELRAWIAWLKGEGASSIALIGHSRGGNQAAMLEAGGQDAPSEVERLVLIAPMTQTPQTSAQSYQSRFGAPLAPILDKAQKLVADGQGDTLLEGVGFLNCPKARVTASAFVDYYAPKENFYTPRLLPAIKVPILVVVGSQDPLSAELTGAMGQLADGKKIIFKTISGADHFFRDLYAEDLADLIAEFIKPKQ